MSPHEDSLMSTPRDSSSDSLSGIGSPSGADGATVAAAEEGLHSLGQMIESLDKPPLLRPQYADDDYENRLVQVRLGMASSLYLALRAKHAPTAIHSLRVALGCSAWAQAMGLSNEERDAIEIAALLHDVGKIGVSEHVLLKPDELTPDETAIMDEYRRWSLEILSGCCSSRQVLEIVRYVPAWFDGSRDGFVIREHDIPLGARMVAIADAFDAMTTDQVYRRAMSREWALGELYSCAGTQFDPELVDSFNEMQSGPQSQLHSGVIRRWLRDLNPDAADGHWRLGQPMADPRPDGKNELFYDKLVDKMHDGVVFVDPTLKIQRWSPGAERISGLPQSGVRDKRWAPSMVRLSDLRGKPVPDEECPIRLSLKNSTQTLRRFTITSDRGREITIDTQVVPVVDASGTLQGAAMLWHDASSESTLEERVQNLHRRATRDPLTQVANRAEFDRELERLVAENLKRQMPCSLIICDLDHFKSINDTYGHQAGDDVLISYAQLMTRLCREGDLVARYGGEEFVMLCPDCDNQSATLRAEEVRRELANIPQSALGGKYITSSFGVTELQQGDTAESMLRRADRALFQAKELGRNTVVQLGTGLQGKEASPQGNWLSGLWNRKQPELVLERSLVTSVPLNVAVEKLRGFVSDNRAQVDSIAEDHVVLKVEAPNMPLMRRKGDRAVPLMIEVDFTEKRLGKNQSPGSPKSLVRTVMRVVIRPKRNRDRRRGDSVERARQLFENLKAYMMAYESGILQYTGDDNPASRRT